MKKKAALFFGEDVNDIDAVIALSRALLPPTLVLQHVRKPIILNPANAGAGKRKANADRVAEAVALWKEKYEVVLLIVHRDCDAVEPAHVVMRDALRTDLSRRTGVPVIPAVPAWETESWLMLFPEAFHDYRPCWSILNLKGRNTGTIVDAKEVLRRALRSKERGCRDYVELHAGPVALCAARYMSNLTALKTRSKSFAAFVDDLDNFSSESEGAC